MTRRESRFRSWILREWECCGLEWQLLLSPKFPERKSWTPACPACGDTVADVKGPEPAPRE